MRFGLKCLVMFVGLIGSVVDVDVVQVLSVSARETTRPFAAIHDDRTGNTSSINTIHLLHFGRRMTRV